LTADVSCASTPDVSRASSSVCRLARWILAFAGLALAAGSALAAQVAVVLSDDSAPYQEVYQVVRAHLTERGHEVQQAYAAGLAAAALSEARLTVAVGVRAAESLAVQPLRTPMLAVLVPRSWYVGGGRSRLSDGGRRTASALFLDQPPERQAQLIRLAFPDAQRVGVLTGAGQQALLDELDDALRTQRLGMVWQKLDPDARLIGPLEQILANADLLLAVPDPQVFNRNTAQSLFLTSYRYRVPVLGYSQSLTRAGALLSLHSSPAQIGRQAAEWLNQALAATPARLPPPAHPAYFDVSINEQVARSLGFVLPPADVLEKQLGGGR
jgi:putative tryptophan/tyrosine transport system substrate-binding protein